MNKKYSLLLAASLITNNAAAQSSDCVVQPTCSQLGYTKAASDCSLLGLSYVQCPFDQSVVACIPKTPAYANATEACKALGYKYSASQCGKQGWNSENTTSYRQLGIPCPYSAGYYYCQYPNQNAQAGWYLCSDGTASSTTSGCGSRSYVVGVVLKAPTYRSRGLVALTHNTYYGHGDLFQAWCNGTYASTSTNYVPGIAGTPRAPDLDTAPSLIRTYFSKIQSEISYNSAKTISYPLWSAECWGPTSGTGNDFSCHIIPSSSSGDTGATVEENHYGVCVADF